MINQFHARPEGGYSSLPGVGSLAEGVDQPVKCEKCNGAYDIRIGQDFAVTPSCALMRTTLWLLMELGAFSSWYGRTSLPHYSRPSPRRHRRHPSTRYPYHSDYTIHRSHQEVIIPPVPFAVIHPPASTTVHFFSCKATVAFTSFKVVLIVLSRWLSTVAPSVTSF